MPVVPVVIPDGAKIRARRKELGLTQAALARRLGPHRHPQPIRYIERANQRTSLKLLTEIAAALGEDPADLILDGDAA